MVNDGGTSFHHDSCQQVNLEALQQEITCISTLFKDLLGTIAQSTQTASPEATTMTTTMTSASMDITNNDLHNDNHWQQVDLLAIQQEIQQTMTSIQSFLASLVPTQDNIIHNNEQSNNQLTMTAWMTKPMTTANMTNWPTTPCNLHDYIAMLHTSACFISKCLLLWTRSRTHVTRFLSTSPPAPAVHTHKCQNTNQWPKTLRPDLSCIQTINDALQHHLTKLHQPNSTTHWTTIKYMDSSIWAP